MAEDVAADASSIKPGEGLEEEVAEAFIEIVAMDADMITLEAEVAAVITVDVMDEDMMIMVLIEAEEPIITVMNEVSARHREETLVLDYLPVSL